MLVGAAASCAFGGSTVLSQYTLSHYHMGALEYSLGRTTIGLCFLVSAALLWRPAALRVRWEQLVALGLLGLVGVGLLQVLFASALPRTSVAVTTVLMYTAPAFVALGSWLVFRERLSAWEIVAVPVTFLGAVLVCRAYDLEALRLSLTGVLCALGAGLCYAIYTLFGKRALVGISPWAMLVYPALFSVAALLLADATRLDGLLRLPPVAWGAMALIAAMTIVLGYSLFLTALRLISATRASVVSTLELVIAPLGAALFLGEALQVPQVAGMMLVLAGTLLVSLGRGRR